MKLKSYITPKCHSILFDLSLNPPFVVYQNAYGLSLLCAVKAHAHMRCLPRRVVETINTHFLFHAVHESAIYFCRLIERRAVKSLDVNQGSLKRVRGDFLVWLNIHAHLRTIEYRPHESTKQLSCLLRSELQSPRYYEARRYLCALTESYSSPFLHLFGK